MNLVFLVTVAIILRCRAEENNQTEVNTPESLNVAKDFRKALLEALEQLEKDEIQYKNKTSNDFDNDDLDASDYAENERTKFGHKIRDKISNQEAIVTSFTDGGKASVLVHSFSTNAENNKLSKEKAMAEYTTIRYRAKQESDNAISASVTSSIAGSDNKITSHTKETINVLPTYTASVTPKTSLSSPNPTVSTPVEEEDETKAKVEDVQFIHAPLVAAFTVEQDDKGLPHKVIPIFGNKQAAQISNQFSNQNSVHNIQASLEDKQRQLEQQIRILQEQKRQQEYLLQQQLLQNQKQIFEDQQQRFKIQNDITSFSQSLQEQNRPSPQHNFQQTLNSPSVQHKNKQNNIKPQEQSLSSQSQSQILTNQQNRFNIPIPGQNDANTFLSRPTKDLSGTVVSFQPSLSSQPQSQILPNHQNRFSIPSSTQNKVNSFLSQTTKDHSGTVISFQPSISFQSNGFTPINPVSNQNLQPQQQFNQLHYNRQQGLPVKAAVNFQKAINIPTNQPENLLTPQQVPNQFRDHVFNNNNDNYLEDFFYRQRTLVPPPRSNRVFRQETQIGNFGLNDFSQNNFQHQHRINQPINYNFNNDGQNFRYNQFNGIRNNVNNNRHVSNKFFNNHNAQQNNVDYRLQNLLQQSGLGGRSQEDLNIVSKVLSLEHTGNYQQNFLFGESNVSEKKIPFKNINRALKT